MGVSVDITYAGDLWLEQGYGLPHGTVFAIWLMLTSDYQPGGLWNYEVEI